MRKHGISQATYIRMVTRDPSIFDSEGDVAGDLARDAFKSAEAFQKVQQERDGPSFQAFSV
jgi:hypothetical protein